MLMSVLLAVTATLGGVSAARADLVRAAEARQNLTTMSADYQQRRTTLLSKKPLEARGKLYYRANPAGAALHVSEPRASRILLTTSRYEVYRPDSNTLERFELKKEMWTSLLTKTMSSQIDTLEQHFVIVRSSLSEGTQARRTIVLQPRSEELKKRIAALELEIDTKRYLLHRVSFTEAGGDRVSFVLRNHKLNPKLAGSLFAAPLDPQTRVITHN